MLSDGTFVSIAGRIATSAYGDFAGFFYIEDSGRASGVRVAVSPSAIAGLERGSVVNVIGISSIYENGGYLSVVLPRGDGDVGGFWAP